MLGTGLAGCGGDRNGPVEAVATEFYTAVADRDGAAACRLLAPATREELEQSAGMPCDRAILEEDLPEPGEVLEVHVYGTAGEVRLGSDTAFLAKFSDGWRVVAAACTARTPQPYDCEVAD